MQFQGQAGPRLRRERAARQRAAPGDALGQRARWTYVEAQSHQRFGGLTGLRFNIGRVEGGIKANMIAPSAEVRFGFRPLPSMTIDALHDALRRASPSRARSQRYEETFRGPSLPAGDVAAAEERRLAARDLADALGLPIGNAVDFWTEASLFSRRRPDRARLRPRRHRPGAHRRRMGRARPTAALHRLHRAHPRRHEHHAHRTTRRPARPSSACCPAWPARRRSRSTSSASRSSTRRASPWSRSAARCCATTSTR